MRRLLPLGLLTAVACAPRVREKADADETTPASRSAGACEDVGTTDRYSRSVSGAHRPCSSDDECSSVKLDCSHLSCTAVHESHAGEYATPIDCDGYSGHMGNYDCDPRFDIEAPRCRDGCCTSERTRPPQ
jgi:hypothetical protein